MGRVHMPIHIRKGLTTMGIQMHTVYTHIPYSLTNKSVLLNRGV